ncbi:Protein DETOXIFICATION 14 [Linum grandiflorum]
MASNTNGTIDAEEQGTNIFATTSRKDFTDELKRIARIAAPMTAVMALQYLQQTVSIVIVGHISQLALTTVGIATALTNVTGYSVLYGMAGGLSTLCGQAYGAGQYKKLGTYTYSGVISLLLMCPPICLLWAFTGRLLRVTGQDPVVADGAREFCLWSIIGLVGTTVVGPLTRFLQAQSVVVPMLLASTMAFCLHALMSWILAFKVRMGDTSVAVAFGLSTWLNAAALALYVKFSGKFKESRAPFTWSALRGIPEFFQLGLPAAVMVCLKWWSMEILTLLSGHLPDPRLQTSVLSVRYATMITYKSCSFYTLMVSDMLFGVLYVSLTMTTLHLTIPLGLGAAVSTRVANELGAGNPRSARLAVVVAVFVAVVESSIVSIALFFARDVVGYAYSNDPQVVKHISTIIPLICVFVVMDSLQGVLSGTATGCGWQRAGVLMNIGAFYLVGLPLGLSLGFAAHLRSTGFWIGIVAGSLVQASLLSIFTCFLDWNNQATKARERVNGSSSSQ